MVLTFLVDWISVYQFWFDAQEWKSVPATKYKKKKKRLILRRLKNIHFRTFFPHVVSFGNMVIIAIFLSRCYFPPYATQGRIPTWELHYFLICFMAFKSKLYRSILINIMNSQSPNIYGSFPALGQSAGQTMTERGWERLLLHSDLDPHYFTPHNAR